MKIYVILFISLFSNILGSSQMEISTLIDNISQSEEALEDIQTDIEFYETESRMPKAKALHWAFKQGKEYCSHIAFDNVTNKDIARVQHAYNGKVHTTFVENFGLPFSSGAISSFDPLQFNIFFSPKYLLGYTVKMYSQQRLNGILRDAKEVHRRESLEIVDGYPCHVIEAIGIQDREIMYNAIVWIDSSRGYRPLKIEVYHQHANKNRWEDIYHRIDNIKLEEIKGVWFPISGDSQRFYITKELPAEISEAEALKLSEEEGMQMLIEVQHTMPKCSMRCITRTLKINEGIQDDIFKIDFPIGCHIWDEFLNTAYIMGGNPNAEDIKEEGTINLNVSQNMIKDPNNSLKPSNTLSHESHKVPKSSTSQASRKGSGSIFLSGFLAVIIFVGMFFLFLRR
jgi:hypothetical protein